MEHTSINAKKKIIIYILLVFEAILFPFIQLDLFDRMSLWQYLAVILACFCALLYFDKKKRVSEDLIRLGLIFTLCADFFLVVLGDHYEAGMCFFLPCQLSYFLYTYLAEERTAVKRANIISRTALSGVILLLVLVVLGESADFLAAISAVYYVNLVLNTVFAFLNFRRMPLMAIGLALFCLCDLCVGLNTLFLDYLNTDPAFLTILYSKYHLLCWVFYQPSQVLIALGAAEPKGA